MTIIKLKFIKLCSLILIFIGCESEEYQNEQLIWEVSPSSDQNFIQNEVNGIKFKFCLLNEDNEPSTVFNEGDNFFMYFSVSNQKHEELYFDPRFPYFLDDFFRIYNSDSLDLGRTFNFDSIYITTEGIGAFPFPQGSIHEYQVTWIDNNESWIWSGGDINKNVDQKHLAKGDYFTNFKYRFHFGDSNGPSFNTDTLQFKINFTIQ